MKDKSCFYGSKNCVYRKKNETEQNKKQARSDSQFKTNIFRQLESLTDELVAKGTFRWKMRAQKA